MTERTFQLGDRVTFAGHRTRDDGQHYYAQTEGVIIWSGLDANDRPTVRIAHDGPHGMRVELAQYVQLKEPAPAGAIPRTVELIEDHHDRADAIRELLD